MAKIKLLPHQTVICFWCKKEKNEIESEVLAQDSNISIYQDDVPCNKCKAVMSTGIVLYEYLTPKDKLFKQYYDLNLLAKARGPHDKLNIYLTGKYIVVTEAFFRQIALNDKLYKAGCKDRLAFLAHKPFEVIEKQLLEIGKDISDW